MALTKQAQTEKEATMAKYTKVFETRQYTEVIFYKDGEEIARETLGDDTAYDVSAPEPMTAQEIMDWS